MTRRSIAAACLVLAAAVLAVTFRPAGAQVQPPLTRNPYLQDMRTDRVRVVWTTPDLAVGTVEFSTDRSFSRRAFATSTEIPPSITQQGFSYHKYEAELAGLNPGTQYFYRVLMDDVEHAPADDYRFRTAAPGPFSFLVFGDSGWGGDPQMGLAQLMFRENPALVLHTGDIAYERGTFEQFRNRHFAVYSPLMRRVPFFPVPGNHEYDTLNAAPYLSLHSPPTETVPPSDRGRYYSFDWGDVHFVALDTNTPFLDAVRAGGPMLQWLENDLRTTRRTWRIVYFHHPARPTSNHENDTTSALVRAHLEPIFDRHDVQLVFSGHEHNYQQAAPRRGGQFVADGQGTVHVITGGGGALLYGVAPRDGLRFGDSSYHYVRAEVQGPRITVRAFRIDGVEIDNFTVTYPPLVTAQSTVNAASFTSGVAPGALVSIFGRLLATGDDRATSLPLPADLVGTTVTVNGQRLPLLFVSRNQINAQMPYDVTGAATLRIIAPGGATESPITISEPAPAIFSTTEQLGDRPAVIHANGTLVTPASPAAPDETVIVFLTGLGRPNGGTLAAGQAAPSSPLLTVTGPVEGQFNSISMTPSFAGLAPGFAGLYQVNVQVPPALTTGTHALRIIARGVTSNTVSLAVRSP